MNEELKVIITAEIGKLKQNLTQAKEEVNKMASSSEKSANQFDKAMEKMEKSSSQNSEKIKKAMKASAVAIGSAVVGVGTALATNIKKTAEYGDNIDKMSQKMGFSAKGFQEWDFIMQHNGSSMETLKASMKTLSQAADKNSDAFARLGISQEQIGKMNQQELFEATVKGLQGVTNEVERTALSGQLLGRGATELGPLLNSSAEDIAKMKQEVNDLGGVMSDKAVKDSALFQDCLQNLQVSTQGLARNFGAELLPSIANTMQGIAQVVSGDDGGFKLIDKGIEDLIEKIKKNLPMAMKTFLKIAFSLSEEIIKALPSLINTVVGAIPIIVEGILNLLPTLIEVGVSIVIAMLEGISTTLPQIIEAMIKAIPNIIKTLTQAIPTLLQASVKFFEAIMDAIPIILPMLIEAMPTIVLTITRELIKSMPLLINCGVELFMALVHSIPKIIPSLKQSLGNIITTIKEHLINKAKNLMNFNWSLPKLKLPHLNIVGKFSVKPPSVPKFNVDWYARGGVFDKPTLFNYGNSLGGLGEDGAEAIVPLENNTEWLDKIAERLSGNGSPIILQVDGKTFAETSISCINNLTKQCGTLPLVLA